MPFPDDTATLGAALGAPRAFLVVSDLHLGAGENTETGRYSRRENFLVADEFRAFLEHHDPIVHPSSVLVLNGDTFDFLRVTDVPKTDADFDSWSTLLSELGRQHDAGRLRGLARRERTYGLRTDDYKSVWKLLLIERGHRRTFDALGWWLEHHGTLVLVKGNHDLELHWPLVQDALRLFLRRRTSAAGETTVRFCDGGFRLANVYVEHGHRFERTTAVPGPPLRPNGRELNYPLGSFVNRYVINKLEDIEPFLDNIKPVGTLLRTVARRHPIRVLLVVNHGARFLLRSLRPYWFRDSLGFLVFSIAFLLPIITGTVIALALAWPAFAAWLGRVLGRARGALGLAGLFGPFLAGLLRDLLPPKRRAAGEDQYAEGIHGVLRTRQDLGGFRRVYGVLGHTHRPDVQVLPAIGSAEVVYLNSGTWTPLWREDRPDLIGRTVCTFLRFRRDGDTYVHETLEWISTHRPERRSLMWEPK